MSVLRDRATPVWLGLMAVTVVSTWGLAKDAVSPTVATVGIFGLAGLKVAFVMLDFMDLRDAPRGPRLAFLLWPAVVVAIVLGFWFAS